MRLLAVELTRIRWRRAAVVIAGAGVLLAALIWAGMAWDTRPVSDADRRDAERMLEMDREAGEAEVQRCLANPEDFGLSPGQTEECEAFRFGAGMSVEDYLYRPQLDPERAVDVGMGVAVLVLGLVMLIGATYAGADWASGSMSNQLLFEPRRSRVWLAKGVAALVAGAVVALGAQAVFWGLTGGLAAARDIDFGSDAWRDIGALVARGTALAACGALGGYALTMLLRSTVGTLGLMLAVGIGGSLLVTALPIESSGRWLLPNNLLGILQDGYPYYDDSAPGCDPFTGEGPCEQLLTLGEGVRMLGTILVVGVALSVASFTRRDVP